MKRAGFKPAPTSPALELARRYMEVFYSGRDAEELLPVLADDMVFEGPFLRCESADDYVDSLRGESRQGLSYEMLGEFESGESACLVYRFSKPGVETTMAQVFETRDGRIARITLVFDTGDFAYGAGRISVNPGADRYPSSPQPWTGYRLSPV